jgi:DNA-binding CsgD family transcriptional regulator
MRRSHTGALLEREQELTQLAGLVDDARAGLGRLVLVEGPPGIGKTRLLEALRARAGEQGMAVLTARASELDREFPFGLVRQLFEPLVAGADESRRAALLKGAAGLAAPLLRLGPSTPGDVEADPSPVNFHALYWLVANLAEEGPVALALDDIHWADPSSLRFLEFLVPRLEGLPVLLAAATRPPEPGVDRRPIDALATDALALVVRPAPLSDRAVTAMIERELGDSPDARFCDACLEATGGNPFLLNELLRELAADGVAPKAAEVPNVRQLAPPTVARAVLLRLARLGEDASALARAVAVLGDGAPLRRACALARLPEERGAELATALAHAGILAAARPLAFAHPILRSAVYADIGPAERATAHRRAAALLAGEGAAADAIAVHLLSTEPAGDAYVVSTLREAAAHALGNGAAPVAVACLRRALAEPPPPAGRGRLILELASAELHAGEPAAAAEHFDEGTRISGDARVRAVCAWEHAVALQALGRHDDAFALREHAAEAVAATDRELALLLETSLIASAGLDLSRLGWAREKLERYRARLSDRTPAESRLLAMQTYFEAMRGDAAAGALADRAERAIASGMLVDRTGLASTPFFAAIEVLWLADRVEPARQALEQAMGRARLRGSALAFACLSGWRCMLLARGGELVHAEADARSCAELALPQGWFNMAAPMLGFVLDVLIARGEFDDAQQLLEHAGMTDRVVENDLALYPMLHARARLRAARGDLAGGRADLACLAGRPARWNTDLTLVPAVLAAPELDSDDPDAATARAEQMLRDAHVWGTPRAIGMALRAAGLVEGGSRGLELLAEAVPVLEGSPARLEHARALADLGAALRRSGRRSDAREPLRQALDLADVCGAGPLAERARQELRAAGGRPRRPRISGAEALTASERRIAAMAVDGLSNPEIAQALFVTKKTVEAHLGSAYRKLGIHSRAQLAGALASEEGV